MTEIHGAEKAREVYFHRYGYYPEDRPTDDFSMRGRQERLLWSKAVIARDDYTCQDCGKRGGKLHAHHIKRWSDFPELRFELSNGTTLCPPCHEIRHKEDKSRWSSRKRTHHRADALDAGSRPPVPLGGDAARGL